MPYPYKGTGEIKVESFWGAISGFILLQLFGFYIFQMFLMFFNQQSELCSPFFVIFGIILIFIFLYFQSVTLKKIRNYMEDYNFYKALSSLEKKDELTKLFLIIPISIFFIVVLLGYFPFLQEKYDFLRLAAFHIFCFVISLIMSRMIKKSYPIFVAKGFNRIVGLIMGIAFFAMGLIFENYIFFEGIVIFRTMTKFLGTIGLGFALVSAITLLIEYQIKEIPDNKNLHRS